jgi:hypothetical protein
MARKSPVTWRHAVVLFAVFGGGVFLIRTWQSRPVAPPEPAGVDTSTATTNPCALRFRSAPDVRVILFRSEIGLNEYLKAAAAADLDAARVVRDTHGAVVVDPGTKCALVERNGDNAKVRITEGESQDKTGWTTLETTGI